jgi:biotin carboxyl carrier protein
MKLQAEIDGEILDIEIKREGEKVFARVADRDYELEVSEPEPNVFLIRDGSDIFESGTSQHPDGNGTSVTVRGSEFDVEIIDPKRLRGAGGDHAYSGGLIEIKTAMPGKVVRLLAAVGDEVKKGDGVIVVEAMKMQNEIKTPHDGVVKEIRTHEGSTANAGEVLMVIE